ncbi:LacI family transcriptional regulator [Duganella sp. BJB488]|uniref:LacI family DNA-binding transcriptional regulator n=1 Tax=unclassified Duganella TaxID=2636909 RepID=UPI000E3491E7|nr:MULTISPECIES: LacI family DNA-binding transcriptional regulator [unclassified Duganella]RFP09314.1 LacI family transcriptional regulator [Duganella sp. BJB475]RFP13202.1 LacI family transcriptional regulator [Duganella sp. BJB489]RFP17038.1 LacI family transcriptional regulator [Duganella sp. BJB488]RFP25350.1 LacI family transcriptional regulator [Duganella sp. BJB476]RFP31557.1 LacI family transcriptional regulator [Duganella sp. BJB480]
MKRVTIKDVAKMAGVSYQTVSLVLNHPEKVAQKTLRTVQETIAVLNFVPSMAARSMRAIRTNTLACIFFGERAAYDNRSFQIQDTYWNNVLQVLGRVADTHGYALMQRSQIGDDAAAYALVRDLFLAGRVDGVVAVVERTGHPVLEQLKRHGLPFVVFGTRDPAFSYVAQNNEEVTAEVVGHLHAAGCRHIAFIGGQRDGRGNEDVEERQRGYARAMREHGLAVHAPWAVSGDWSLASGHRIARELCGTGDRPDALIFASDRMALGALKGLHELGVNVPGDVSVVGFDNMHYDDYCIPPLSSVHSPVLEMAQASVQMLLDQILGAGAAPPVQRVFPAGLVVRESSQRAGPARR